MRRTSTSAEDRGPGQILCTSSGTPQGDKLPDHLASAVTKRMRKAYHAESALAAEAR